MTSPQLVPSCPGSPHGAATRQPHLREVRSLLAEAEAALTTHGFHVSPSRLHRLVSRYAHESLAGQDFAAWFIGYRDPTGETAVRNIMTEERRRG